MLARRAALPPCVKPSDFLGFWPHTRQSIKLKPSLSIMSNSFILPVNVKMLCIDSVWVAGGIFQAEALAPSHSQECIGDQDMKLNLRQLEAFRAIVIFGSVTGAAKFIGISQPAVSRLLADLERSVDFELFERRKRRLFLKPEGRILHQEIEKSFVGIEKIAQKAHEVRNLKVGYLNIAAMPALSLSLLADVLAEFAHKYVGANVSLQIRSSTKIVDWIADQQFDLGLAAAPFDHEGIDVLYKWSPSCMCVLPKRHRLAKKKIIEASDLEGENFISYNRDIMLRFEIDKCFEQAGVKRHLKIETQMSAIICDFVANGIGVSIVDPFSAMNCDSSKVLAKQFRPHVPYRFGILVPAHIPRSRITDVFVGMLMRHLEPLASSAPEG